MTSPIDSGLGSITSDARTASGGPVNRADPVPAAPRRGRRVLAVVGPVVALLVASIVPMILLQLVLPSTAGEGSTGAAVAYVVGASLLVCAAAVGLCALLLRWHGLRLRDAGIRGTRVSLPSLLAGLAIGSAVVIGIGLPLARLGVLRPEEGTGMTGWALVVAGLAQAFVLQGLPEELLFRGYQMTALRLRPVAALFVSAAVFASIHLISNGGQANALERVLYLATPFGFAVAGGALMILTDSLWAAVGVHAGMHVGALVGSFLGIGSGPQMWLLCGVVWTVIGCVLLAVAHRRGRLAGIWRGPQH